MFTDRLKSLLTLTIGSASFEVPAGSIQRFEVDVQPWGFDATIHFVVDSSQAPDPIFGPFTGTTLIGATFTFVRAVEGVSDDSGGFKVVGYGVERAVAETVGASMKGAPVIKRLYTLRVVDAGQAFWKQHRPIDLYAAATMETVFDLHKPVGVALTYDWSILQEKQDIICLSLHGEGVASYYDFVIWYVERNQGVLEFDARAGAYRIGGKKARGGDAVALDAEDIASISLVFPEPPRFAGRVLNPFSVTPVTRSLANTLAATGVRRDVIEHTLISANVDRRAQVESSRFRARSHGVVITYKRCPAIVSQPLDFITVGDGFSDAVLPSGSKYRGVRLRASAVQNEKSLAEVDDALVVYDLDITLEVENSGSAVAWLPPFSDPRRIVRLEGTVVSSGGEATDRSWAAVENSDDSLWTYKINVPLYNKVIPVPFAPTYLSGHFFFPAYKDQRVLVDVDWDRATLAGFIDWADEARVPSASQGDQIVLGYQSTNGTIIKHDYQDAKPELNIVRKNSGQTATFSMTDGNVLISLSEVVTVPTALPLYDVSPQVDAAKDAVTGEVGGAVGAVTAQFQGAVGGVSAQIDESTAAIDAEIGATEKKIKGDLLAVDGELQGMAGDANAAMMSISNATRTAKAKVTNSVQGLDEVRAPLVDADTRITTFLTVVDLQNAALKKDISELDAGVAQRCDQPEGDVGRLREEVKNRLATLRADISALGPGATSGPFADLAALRNDIDAQSGAARRAQSDVDADVSSCVTKLAGGWAPVDSALSSRRTATGAKYDALLASASTQQGQLAAKLQAAVAAGGPTAASEAAIIRPGLDSLKDAARAALQPARDRALSTLDSVASEVSAKKKQMNSSAVTAGAPAKLSAASIGARVPPLLASADGVKTSLEATSASLKASTTARANALDQTTTAELTRLSSSIKDSKTAVMASAATAKQTLTATLGSVTSISGVINTTARVPVQAALGVVTSTRQSANTIVAATSTALDTALATASGTLQGFIDAFMALVNGASASLGALNALIAGMRAEIMPPIEALQDIVGELETIFQTGANVLTAFIDTASATLDAIPAAALPEALVSPAVQGIQAALSAVLPLVTEAATAAGTQLQTMATTLMAQVGTAEQAGMTGITTFAGTMNTQIQAILPPVKAQLATVQTQIDGAVTAFENQLASVADAAVAQVNTAIGLAATQATTATGTADSALGTGKTQLDTAVGGVRAQLATSKTTLGGQVDTAVGQLGTQIEGTRTTFSTSLAGINESVAGAKATLEQQLVTQRVPLDTQLAQIKTELAGVRPAAAPNLAGVETLNDAAVSQLSVTIPAQAVLDAQLDAAWAGFAPRLAAIETAIGQI